jgi:hypothetical protein
MQTPHSLDEAMARVKAEEAKVSTSFHAFVGSRWVMAILSTSCLAFGLHAVYAPTWLPSFTGLSLTAWGLPSGLDWGVAGQEAQEAAAAAQRQGVGAHVQAIADQHANLFPLFNAGGFALCLVLLLVNMTIMTKRRSFTRG